jgi:uncharacterized protein
VSERIEAGYRHRFRRLLAELRSGRLERGVELLLGRARRRAAREHRPLRDALAELDEETRRRVRRRQAQSAACSGAASKGTSAKAPRFLCDLSLGGLARWLRAAGYEARSAGEAGDALLAAARHSGELLLTTDSRLLERRAVRSGELALLWVPSSLCRLAQLALVLDDLRLPLCEPRCMACGGALRAVEMQAVLERIPPRTARWLGDYWVCSSCDRLLWRGTHWGRIAARLAALGGAGEP